MASKTLTAKVKFDTSSAEKSLDRLSKKINSVQNAIKKTSSNNTKLTKELNKATSATNKMNTAANKVANTTNKIASTTQKVTNATRQASTQARSLGSSYHSANKSANTLLTTVKKLSKTYLGVMGMKAIINASDTITSAQNRLNNLEGGSPELTDVTMDKIYSASQRSRSGYSDMMANVSKSMTLAPDAFQRNIDNAIRFQEIMSKSYAVGGASAAEQSSSMYQLMQALGSGKLQGDELRSVAEGAPLAYKQIEKHVQSLMATTEETAKYAKMSLKDIAADGLVTSAMVVDAIMASEDKITESFNNTSMTFEQAWKMIQNTAVKAFEPTLEILNKLLNHPIVASLMPVFGGLLSFIGNVVGGIFNIILGLFDGIAANWGVLSKVLLSLATILGGVLLGKLILNLMTVGGLIKKYILLGVEAVKSAIKSAISWLTLSLPLTLIILLLVALVIVLIWVSDSFADACGIVVGVIMGAISVIWNAFVTLVALILKNVLLPLTTSWDNFANFLGNMINDPIGAIVHSFADMADTVLSMLQTIASGIDAVFGTKLAKSVQGWRDGLATTADELATKLGNGTYEQKSDVTTWLEGKIDSLQDWAMWDTSDAYQTGYDWGFAGGNWITETLGGLFGGLPDPNSDENKYDEDSYKMLEGIETNTDAISDSMDLRDDDLEFLRKVAEMEWRNEFTTAEIRVDMTNNNTVTAERDLDGIVEYLSDVLREEMTNVAEGVHY